MRNDAATKDMFTRRKFLGAGSAAVAGAGMLAGETAAHSQQQPYPPSGDEPAALSICLLF
jgi:hypothetical protein